MNISSSFFRVLEDIGNSISVLVILLACSHVCWIIPPSEEFGMLVDTEILSEFFKF